MFAIFLSDSIAPFYQNIASFPTVIFTFFLGLAFLFWLVAIAGWLDINALDIDIDIPEGDVNDTSKNNLSTADVLGGLMLKLGLNGIPVTVVVSIIALIGWIISYYLVHFLMPWVPNGILRYIAGLPIFLVSLYVSVLITAKIIAPIRGLFKASSEHSPAIIGQTAIVRTSRVDRHFGEAILEDGGAGLLLKVRATGDATFVKHDRVVIIEHMQDSGAYRIVSEHEFSGL